MDLLHDLFNGNNFSDDFPLDDYAFKDFPLERVGIVRRLPVIPHLSAQCTGFPPEVGKRNQPCAHDEYQQHGREHQSDNNQRYGRDQRDHPADE